MKFFLFLLLLLINLQTFAQQAEVYQAQNIRYWQINPLNNKPTQAKTFKQFPNDWKKLNITSNEVWYEFTVPDQHIPTSLSGILIERLYLNANVFLNQQLIGSGGSMKAPIAKNAHHPLLFTIPKSAWQKTNNKIQVQHKSYTGFGYIKNITLGSIEKLEPIYRHLYTWQQILPQIIFAVEILFMGLIFYLWLSQPKKMAYLWFCMTLLSLSIVTANHFIINLWVPHKIWATINNIAIDWWIVFLSLYIYRQLKLVNKTRDKALYAFLFASMVFYVLLPLPQLPGSVIFHFFAFVILIANLLYFIYLKSKPLPTTQYITLFALLTLIAINDFAIQLGLNNNGRFILFYVAPLACFVIAIQIMNAFIIAMKQKEDYAQKLSNRIKQVKLELNTQYELLNKSNRQQATLQERERIYRDLHDDVGAKLLSLYYQEENTKVGLLAKSALDDLRDIVANKHNQNNTLINALQQWQTEANNRATEAGAILHWQNIITHDTKLQQNQFMHLSRILREAISNAIKFKQADTNIDVVIKLETNHLLNISIKNSITSIEPKHWQYGRGLNNILQRTNELNGTFLIEDGDNHMVCLSWSIPLN